MKSPLLTKKIDKIVLMQKSAFIETIKEEEESSYNSSNSKQCKSDYQTVNKNENDVTSNNFYQRKFNLTKSTPESPLLIHSKSNESIHKHQKPKMDQR